MAAAALQKTPTYHTIKPTAQLLPKSSPLKLSLTSTLTLPKLSLPNRRRSVVRHAESAAGSYANALADVAISNNTLEQTFSDIEKLDKLFSEEPILNYFTNPIVAVEEKQKLIDEVAKSSSLQPHVANFLNILLEMKRIDMIKEIVKEFELVWNRLTETQVATVTSVVPLEAQHLAQIAKGVQKLTGSKNVRIKTEIDKSLVAGFTIKFGNSGSKLIDMSVKKQLEEIASQLDLGDIQLAV